MGFFSSSNTSGKKPPAGLPAGPSQQPTVPGSHHHTPLAGGGNNRILPLDINGLYILLSRQAVPKKWHWALYLHRDTSKGWIFHATRPMDFWFYDQRTSTTIIYSESIVTALKIAVIDPDMHEALRDRVAQVPVENTERFGEFTCRTWVLRAMDELDNEGYISLYPGATVEDIEEEAKEAAGDSDSPAGRRVDNSLFSRA